ncbi:hypothetical protein OY671_008036, partial [Metschnikowia pulcherrima]
ASTAQAAASPSDKKDAIARSQEAGRNVSMVGDGLNDGPALAAATASIAPGRASAVGRQAADSVFTGDSSLASPRAVRAARATMRVVRQNFVSAIGYNVSAVPSAMAGVVTPSIAAVAIIAFLLPIASGMGSFGSAAFFWASRKGQFNDSDGAAARISIDENEEG